MNEEQIYSLCEAVADIAYIAGEKQYHTGNSREDIANFIQWAKEFEKINEGVEWGIDEGKEYIDAIHEFTVSKLNAGRHDG